VGGLPLTPTDAPQDVPETVPETGDPRWAMQLVMRVERADPPTRSALCEAAATAVVRLLADPRCEQGGPWHPSVLRWASGPIRKHARRARGAAWERVQELEGVTVEHAGAQVRALVPTPLGGLPREVAKLPLTGWEPEVLGATVLDPERGGPLVVSITGDPVIPLGKAVAAAGHAAQLAWLDLPRRRLSVWAATGFEVVVEHPGPERWRVVRRSAPVRVLDGGLTVVAPGTCTAVVRWR